VSIAQDAAANAPHHRAVPAQQQRERRLIPLGDEVLQQFSVRSALAHPLKGDATDLIQQAIALAHRYGGSGAAPRHLSSLHIGRNRPGASIYFQRKEKTSN
jgi:hypothetical protein